MPLLSRSEPLCGQIWSRWYLFSEVLLEQPAAGQLAPANGHNPTVWNKLVTGMTEKVKLFNFYRPLSIILI